MLKAKSLEDSDGQVRLAAFLALSGVPASADAGKALFAALDQPNLTLDQWMVDAAKIAASNHHTSFLASARPEQIAAARQALKNPTLPTLTLADFENSPVGALTGWDVQLTSGAARAQVVATGRTSSRSLELKAAASGGDIRVSRKVAVKKNTRYDFSYYVKTQDVVTQKKSLGALALFPEIQRARPAMGVAMKDTADWSRMRLQFDTGEFEEITLECVLGYEGTVAGTAWFDEITLTDLGPSDETIAQPLQVVLGHVIQQQSGSGLGAASDSLGGVELKLGVIPDVMKYDVAELSVKAGEKVRLTFQNKDHMQHNALILSPGRVDAVGALADAMLTDPRALSKNYVPDSPDVLFFTPLVNPGETYVLAFTAPSQPARYPIVCTFPGHWRMMQSVLVVK